MDGLHIEVLGRMKSSEGVLYPFPTIITMYIEGTEISVGSRYDKPPGLVFNEVGVSRRHARLYLRDGTWHVEDLGSDNGTWIIEDGTLQNVTFGESTAIHRTTMLLFGVIVTSVHLIVPPSGNTGT